MKLLLIAALVVVAVAQPPPPGDKHVVQDIKETLKNLDARVIMNEEFDAILVAAREYMIANGLVPMTLPDSLEGFCVRYLFVDWHGELELTAGTLFDLSSIARRGDAEFIPGLRESHFKAVIGFDLIDINYDYLAKVMGIGPDGGIEAKVTDVTFDIDIVYNLITGDAEVLTLDVLSTGSMRIILTGTAIIDEIFNAIALVITILFKNSIMDMIAAVLKAAINNALAGGSVPTTEVPTTVFY